jgi:membrane protein DedA with SNARE-associated domain/rhodanese-related sulfurtransferase
VASPLGLSVVFFNVLLDQLGLPLPALPTLIVAGALAADGRLSWSAVLLLALTACVLGDSAWYLAGRAYGSRVMKLLCRISLTPDICVSETQTSFERWGDKALLFAKFVPGLAMVAPPLAGAIRMSVPRFMLLSLAGSTAWVGAALLGGVLLKPQIEKLLPRLAGVGSAALLIVLLLLAAYVSYRWWDRRRFFSALDMARISVDELYTQMQGAPAPIVVDVRSLTAQELQSRRIPGALHVPAHDVARHVSSLPRDRDIIFYCTCPNEASAAQAARLLMRHGFRRVRPLHGGLDAWIAAGYAVEEVGFTPDAAASATLAGSQRFISDAGKPR